ncbi:MAG: hypothetical protein CO108_07205 [Deltaproteobacteria bacterium CG_4_9_14_3_um_filter_63_12]|nr:MAG: hypothetical protein CO108_07205 [Deltaproteobacteria bacterium CG_4_9_14_3_um_filter_63_12]
MTRSASNLLLALAVLLFATSCGPDTEKRAQEDVFDDLHGNEPTIADPTVGGVTVHESAMSLAVVDGQCTLRLPVKLEGHASGLDAKLTIDPLWLDHTPVGPVDSWSDHLDGGEQVLAIPLTESCMVGDDRLSEMLLRYDIAWGKHSIVGVRSLFRLAPKLQTRVLGAAELLEGEGTLYRVLATDPESGEAVANAQVSASFRVDDVEVATAEGLTDESGTTQLQIASPAGRVGLGVLDVRIATQSHGEQSALANVRVSRHAKIMLTTDKPFYQPGQTIHIRALALAVPKQTPLAGEELLLEVRDPKGNLVYKSVADTSDFGVAVGEFTLASLVGLGHYTVQATLHDSVLGDITGKKTFTVDHYALPRFRVAFSPDQTSYQPGQTLSGTVQADYFYGKPVDGGTVHVVAKQFDVESRDFATLDGVLDDTGAWSFSLDLPDYFVGSELEQGKSSVMLELTVTDKAHHAQTLNRSLPVVPDPILIDVIPEAGRVLTGVEQRYFLLLSSPLGEPVAGVATVRQGPTTTDVSVGPTGIASFTFVASEGSFVVTVDDGSVVVSRTLALTTDQNDELLIVSVAKAIFDVGESVAIDVRVMGRPALPVPALLPDRVYLDVIQSGQPRLMTTLELTDGQGQSTLELDASLNGPLELVAYYLTPEGRIVRANRVLFVRDSTELSVAVETDKPTYRPRETANVTLTVSDGDGVGTRAALGVTLVDEAVFALQEFQPGVEQTYFKLEQDIMTPTYEIHGFSPSELYAREPAEEVAAAAQQQRAEAFFASNGEDAVYGVSVETFEALKAHNIDASERAARDIVYTAIPNATTYCGRISAVTARFDDPLFFDPWGNRYWVDGGQQGCSLSLTMRSAGQNERFDDEDDVYADRTAYCCTHDDYNYADATSTMDSGSFADALSDGSEPPTDTPAGIVPLRSWFPETLLALPQLLTDASGKAIFDVVMPDSITSWRLTALANSSSGQLGSTSDGIVVYQDFFVDIDFPAYLTQGDVVHVPIGIYNYLSTEQQLTLTARDESWFTALDGLSRQLTVPANAVTAVYFPIRVERIGHFSFTVDAVGSAASDSVQRQVDVRPDGVERVAVESDRLSTSTSLNLNIPTNAIPDSEKLWVKLVPGVMAQAIDGLDSILSMPSGCFEQTSSSTYPNVMVLQYMAAIGQLTPEVELKARDYIAQGYQRLLTFEVEGGGFEWFGQSPAHSVLTCYGLMEFVDMAQVYPVDPDLIARTAAWLVQQQDSDGAFIPTTGGVAEGAIDNYADSLLRTTAYVVWALARAEQQPQAMAAGANYLLTHHSEAGDPYTQALVAMALIQSGRQDSTAVSALLSGVLAGAVADGEGGFYWEQGVKTEFYSSGGSASLETTALIGLVLLADGGHNAEIDGILSWLSRQKDQFGTWSTTQGTVLALRLLIESSTSTSGDANGTVTVSANGGQAFELQVTPSNSDVVRLVDLTAYLSPGDNQVTIELVGTPGRMTYEAAASWYVPGEDIPASQGPLQIDVAYVTGQLAVNDTVGVRVAISNTSDASVSMVLASVGLPPGFELVPDLLDAATADGSVLQRYEVTPRQLIFYLYQVGPGETVAFDYALLARWPMNGSTGSASVYPYYEPEQDSEQEAQNIEVL